MARYAFHDVLLDVQPDAIEVRARLVAFWPNLSLVPSNAAPDKFRHHVSILLHDTPIKVPDTGHLLFQAEEFSVIEEGDTFYLTDGSSIFRLQPEAGSGDAFVVPSFFSKPEIAQYNFWSFGLLKLFRARRLFCLHSAGLVTPAGTGLLVIGPSGSGKSTLALGLIRRGWSYLTDDAVLLHPSRKGVSAFALREHFYIDHSEAPANSDLPLGTVAADRAGNQRQRLLLQDSHLSSKRRLECVPDILLFSRIAHSEHSSLSPMESGTALKHLLEASGPQLFDRQMMSEHLNVLKGLLEQSTSLELEAGMDIYRDPGILVSLLSEHHARRPMWPELSSS